ncbi:hypothetical protein KCV01_g3529, partial [Aureobasidium melanogenum]
MFMDGSDGLPVDRQQARHWLGLAAAQGDNEAGLRLASLDAVPEDAVAPERIARLGPQDAEGQFDLGRRLSTGDGVARNDPEAVRWLAQAADRDHAGAQCLLAQMIDGGRGVPRNVEEVLRLYRLAATQGLPEAQYELGRFHEAGDGVPRNLSVARAWYRKAAARGHLKAMRRLEPRPWWKLWS